MAGIGCKNALANFAWTGNFCEKCSPGRKNRKKIQFFYRIEGAFSGARRKGTIHAGPAKAFVFLLMLTLFSVLVVPMSFLFLGLYSSTFSMVHTDYLEMNTQLSHTISQQVDTYLYARMNFAFYLSQSRAAQKLAAQVEDSYEDATEIFRQLASSMAAIQSYDNVFSMAAIYFPKRGEICAYVPVAGVEGEYLPLVAANDGCFLYPQGKQLYMRRLLPQTVESDTPAGSGLGRLIIEDQDGQIYGWVDLTLKDF